MRTEQEIMDKFNLMYANALRERKEEYISRMPINCKHNFRVRLQKFGKIGFCGLAKHRNRCVCNDEDCVKNCQDFECKSTPESVASDLNYVLANPQLCGQQYPKLAIILWFLQKNNETTRQKRFMSGIMEIFRSLGRFIFFKWW